MIVSMAFWRSRRAADQGRPVSSLIDQLIEDDFRFNHHLYMDGDELLVHRVLRFETLADDLADVAVRLGTTMLPSCRAPRVESGQGTRWPNRFLQRARSSASSMHARSSSGCLAMIQSGADVICPPADGRSAARAGA